MTTAAAQPGPSDFGVITVCTRLHNYPQPTWADWAANDPRLTNCPVCGALEFRAEPSDA